ncbi:MAG: hypothetical protein JXB50_14660 [Spirochaetes bacterium]|nr:hypothetical protein [Spirochaetota bacterium]
MKKKFLYIAFIFIFFVSCIKIIRQGVKPEIIDKTIPFEYGKYLIADEKIMVKFAIVENFIKKDSDDIIFYLHGINRSELEWIEENGFGAMFYNVIKENPSLDSFTVISISLGGAFVFIEDAPFPYSANLESLFLNNIIPYFKNKYLKTGNVYLIGHSLGGYNSITISFRYPDKIKAIAVISPYVAPISPFSSDFDKKGTELNMPKLQVKILKTLLISAYESESKWFEYNPFMLIEKQDKFPYISISDAKNDLPGFEWSIDNFVKELEKNNIEHAYCKSEGDHRSTCKKIFYNFLEKISND